MPLHARCERARRRRAGGVRCAQPGGRRGRRRRLAARAGAANLVGLVADVVVRSCVHAVAALGIALVVLRTAAGHRLVACARPVRMSRAARPIVSVRAPAHRVRARTCRAAERPCRGGACAARKCTRSIHVNARCTPINGRQHNVRPAGVDTAARCRWRTTRRVVRSGRLAGKAQGTTRLRESNRSSEEVAARATPIAL